MAGNKLYGNVPELPRSLTELSLSNNALDGGIPQLPPTLRLLDLSENQMTGTLDVANVSVCTELVSLDLSGNSLQGNLPLMTSYNIEVCTFYVIRVFYEKPTKFQFVDLSSNQFSGQIPPSYRNFVNFNTLNLSTNSLTGVIPEFQSWNLRTLDLSGNFLAGNMIMLSYVQNLDYLDVSNNNLNGSLPNAITNMTKLNYINMVSFFEILIIGNIRVVSKCIFPLSVFVLRQSRKDMFLCGEAACTKTVAAQLQQKKIHFDAT
jgi:Leucine-rich repeat (LRR) protein